MSVGHSHHRDFFRAMEMHLEAGRLLLNGSHNAATTGNYMAIYHSGYAVECALKARYLRTQKGSHQGRVIRDVFKKRVKHDLDELKLMLDEEDVFLERRTKLGLQIVKSRWSTEMRYHSELVDYPDALAVFRAAEIIARWSER